MGDDFATSRGSHQGDGKKVLLGYPSDQRARRESFHRESPHPVDLALMAGVYSTNTRGDPARPGRSMARVFRILGLLPRARYRE